MLELHYIIVILELIAFSIFGWALFSWFEKSDKVNRWELSYIKIGGIIFTILHLLVALFIFNPLIGCSIIGICLLLISILLFLYSYSIFKNQAPAVAFSDHITTPLKTNGPYKVIRNPMYVSYSLTWLGGTMATGCLWLSISFFLMGYIYWKAAKEEETQWLSGKDSEAYKHYMLNTGMFIPKLL